MSVELDLTLPLPRFALRVEAKLPAWQERAQAVKDILHQLAA